MKIEQWKLKQRQSLSLEVKIELTKMKILSFYNNYGGNIYVAYSGGKDSEVLLHLAKQVNKSIKAIFVDTGTEIDTKNHAIKKADIVLKPKKSMLEVWEKYGVPFPSKQQANFIEKAKNTKSDYLRSRLLTGIMKDGSKTMFKISEKWKPIIDSDIKVSDKCCYYLKKEPFKRYNKQTGEKPMIGTMATDGRERKKMYLQSGCINFEREVATPLGFWTDQDILEYLKKFNVDYCKSAYGDIIEIEGKLKTTKATRTGCIGCGFGVHLEKEPNRFQRMDEKQRDVILNKWCNGSLGKLCKMYDIKTKLDTVLK